MHYVYFLICPITLDVKYIGYSKNPTMRLRDHLSLAMSMGEDLRRLTDRYRERVVWMRSLREKKLRPIIATAYEFKTKPEALEKEAELITKHYDKITNCSHGRINFNI